MSALTQLGDNLAVGFGAALAPVNLLLGVIGVTLGFALVWVFFRNGLDLTGLMPADLTFAGIVFDPIMYPVIEVRHLAQSLFFIAVIGVSASVFPAWQAAALDPAESVKVE